MGASNRIEVSIGSTYQLSRLPIIVSEAEFNSKIASFKDGTAPRYYERAKCLIIRGFLLHGQDAKPIPDTDADEIVAGTAENEARIFLLRANKEAIVLWKGPKSEYRVNYRRIRDKHCGPVRPQRYGRAVNVRRNAPPPNSPKVEATPRERHDGEGTLHGGANELHERIKRCCGGCLRGNGPANPMFRPLGRYILPSPILFILEQPNEDDDRINRCLTIGPEDYVKGKPDRSAQALQELFSDIGLDYRQIYIINSLLCWQGLKQDRWDACWLPCLSHGWLKDIVEACNPTIIVTFGRKALRTVHHMSGKPLPGDPIMSNEVCEARMLGGRHVFPLFHPSPNATQTRSLDLQREEDWPKLKTFLKGLRLI